MGSTRTEFIVPEHKLVVNTQYLVTITWSFPYCFLQAVLRSKRFLSANTMRFQKVTNLNPWSTNACQKRHGEDNLTHHNFDGQKFCLIWRVIINNLPDTSSILLNINEQRLFKLNYSKMQNLKHFKFKKRIQKISISKNVWPLLF